MAAAAAAAAQNPGLGFQLLSFSRKMVFVDLLLGSCHKPAPSLKASLILLT